MLVVYRVSYSCINWHYFVYQWYKKDYLSWVLKIANQGRSALVLSWQWRNFNQPYSPSSSQQLPNSHVLPGRGVSASPRLPNGISSAKYGRAPNYMEFSPRMSPIKIQRISAAECGCTLSVKWVRKSFLSWWAEAAAEISRVLINLGLQLARLPDQHRCQL